MTVHGASIGGRALGLLVPLACLLVAMVSCEPAGRCLTYAMTPDWCVRTCEGQSFEWLLDPLFGERCGFCRCFENPHPTDPAAPSASAAVVH